MTLLLVIGWVASLAFAYWMGRSDERCEQKVAHMCDVIDRASAAFATPPAKQ